jgi:hypothetical protein
LGIDIMAAGAGQAGEDCRRPSRAWVSDEEGIFAVENAALHLAFGDVDQSVDPSTEWVFGTAN